MQQDADSDVEKSVESDVEVETTATDDEMRNLQGCEDSQKTDVKEWQATDDLAYCNTNLNDKIYWWSLVMLQINQRIMKTLTLTMTKHS
jgi:hypothetical protein